MSDDRERLKAELLQRIQDLQMGPLVSHREYVAPERTILREGYRAYLWKAQLIGGHIAVTGRISVDGVLPEDVVRMKAYQQFDKMASLKVVGPGQVECVVSPPGGGRYSMGTFRSPHAWTAGIFDFDAVKADLEKSVVIDLVCDGANADYVIRDEIHRMPEGGATPLEEDVAGGRSVDLANFGQELEL